MQLTIVHEDIEGAVGVARDQVVRGRMEGDEAAIRGQRDFGRQPVRLVAVVIDADARGLVGDPIVNQDIAGLVEVPGDEVVGVGDERDPAPVRRKRARRGLPIALGAGRIG
jgi:hypothetical protein